MFRIQFPYRNHATGDDGVLYVHGGQWVGDECVFEFAASSLGVTGIARADWRAPTPTFELTDGSVGEPAVAALLASLAEHLAPFHSGAFAHVAPSELAALYGDEYHTDQNYAQSSEFERARKGVLADLTIAVAGPQKVLVAGCSAGECLRQLRARGVEAFGFDVSANVADIAYPEVRAFVRSGDIAAIPFDAADGFDTLTAFDVFEHILESQIPNMVAEFRRLGIETIVALIAHCEFQYRGHVTLRPIEWWDRALSPWYRRVPLCELPSRWPAVEPQSHDPSKLVRVFRRN